MTKETEFDPELVEQAARVICHPHHHAIAAGHFACYLCEPRILAVLTAVAPTLRAEQREQIAQTFERTEPGCPYEHKGCGHFGCEAAQFVRRSK